MGKADSSTGGRGNAGKKGRQSRCELLQLVLQCVSMCCSALPCVAVSEYMWEGRERRGRMGVVATGVALYSSVLQRVAVCGTGVAVWGSVWQC